MRIPLASVCSQGLCPLLQARGCDDVFQAAIRSLDVFLVALGGVDCVNHFAQVMQEQRQWCRRQYLHLEHRQGVLEG